MAIETTDELSNFLKFLTGEEFPAANEDRIFTVAQAHHDAADGIVGSTDTFAGGVRMFRAGMSGDAEKAYVDTMEQYVLHNPGFLGIAGKYVHRMGKGYRDTATEVQYAKLMIIASLIQLFLEFLAALALAWINPGLALSRLAIGKAVMEFLKNSLLARILLRIVISQILGVGMQVLMDVFVQMYQRKTHTRDRWNPNLTKSAAAIGSLGGAVGLGFSGIFDLAERIFKRMDLGDQLTNLTKPKLTPGENPVPEILNEGLSEYFTEGLYSAMIGQGWDVDGIAFVAGALSGVAGSSGTALGEGLRGMHEAKKAGGRGATPDVPLPLYTASPSPDETMLASAPPPAYEADPGTTGGAGAGPASGAAGSGGTTGARSTVEPAPAHPASLADAGAVPPDLADVVVPNVLAPSDVAPAAVQEGAAAASTVDGAAVTPVPSGPGGGTPSTTTTGPASTAAAGAPAASPASGNPPASNTVTSAGRPSAVSSLTGGTGAPGPSRQAGGGEGSWAGPAPASVPASLASPAAAVPESLAQPPPATVPEPPTQPASATAPGSPAGPESVTAPEPATDPLSQPAARLEAALAPALAARGGAVPRLGALLDAVTGRRRSMVDGAGDGPAAVERELASGLGTTWQPVPDLKTVLSAVRDGGPRSVALVLTGDGQDGFAVVNDAGELYRVETTAEPGTRVRPVTARAEPLSGARAVVLDRDAAPFTLAPAAPPTGGLTRAADGRWFAGGGELLVRPLPDGRAGVVLLSDEDLARLGGVSPVPATASVPVLVRGSGDGRVLVPVRHAGGGVEQVPLDATELHRVLADRVDAGRSVALLSCAAGSLGAAFAQRLAELGGWDVLAPAGDLVVGSRPGTDGPISTDGRPWVLFTPDPVDGTGWDVVNDELADGTVRAFDGFASREPVDPPAVDDGDGVHLASGWEAELQHIRLTVDERAVAALTEGTEGGAGAVELVKAGHVRIVLDGPPHGRVPEVVVDPVALLPGEDDFVSVSDAFRDFDRVVDRMNEISSGRPRTAAELFAGPHYEIREGFGDAQFQRSAENEMMMVHYSVGVPLARLAEVLKRVAEKTFVAPARGHVTRGLGIGTEYARLFGQTFGAQATAQARNEVAGFLALTYTQVAAVRDAHFRDAGQGIGNYKDQAAAVSRVSLATIRAGMSPAGRAFLAAHVDGITARFDTEFRTEWKDYPLRNNDQLTAEDYLNSALGSSTPPIDQFTALGVRTKFTHLDDHGGALDPPLVVIELRSYGSTTGRTSMALLRDNHDTVAGWGSDTYNEVRRERGLPASKLPRTDIEAPPTFQELVAGASGVFEVDARGDHLADGQKESLDALGRKIADAVAAGRQRDGQARFVVRVEGGSNGSKLFGAGAEAAGQRRADRALERIQRSAEVALHQSGGPADAVSFDASSRGKEPSGSPHAAQVAAAAAGDRGHRRVLAWLEPYLPPGAPQPAPAAGPSVPRTPPWERDTPALNWDVLNMSTSSARTLGATVPIRSDHSAESLREAYPWIGDINPDRDRGGELDTNCVIAAIGLVLSMREGMVFEASGSTPLPGGDLVNFQRDMLGLPDGEHRAYLVDDLDGARDALAAAEPGALALVVMRGPEGDVAHVVVGVRDASGVSFVDPQTGALAERPVEPNGYAFLPLSPDIPAPAGGTPAVDPAEALLADLEAASAPAVAEPDDLIGPDVFGLLTPEPAPGFLARVRQADLAADQLNGFFGYLDMAHPRRVEAPVETGTIPAAAGSAWEFDRPDGGRWWGPGEATGLPELPAVGHLPLTIHSVWLGGPLSHVEAGGSRATHEVMENLARMAELGWPVQLWTDVSRAEFEMARRYGRDELLPDDPARRARLAQVLDTHRWARRTGIRLVNVDEVFHRGEPMVLDRLYRMEMNKQVGAGYAAASDILRLEILVRFGGLYTDGDNSITGPAREPAPTGDPRWQQQIVDRAGTRGFAVHGNGSMRGNSALLGLRGHPFFELLRDQVARRYRDRQELLPGLDPRPSREDAELQARVPALRPRRHSVLARTGPDNLAPAAVRAGFEGAHQLPVLTEITMGAANSWVDPAPFAPRRSYTGQEAPGVLRGVVATLVRGLHNRDGDLHLTAVAPVLAGLPDPGAAARAAVEFILRHPELGPPVRTVTDRALVPQPDGRSTVEVLPLPDVLRERLGITGEPTEGDGSMWRHTELSRPAAVTVPAVEERRTALAGIVDAIAGVEAVAAPAPGAFTTPPPFGARSERAVAAAARPTRQEANRSRLAVSGDAGPPRRTRLDPLTDLTAMVNRELRRIAPGAERVSERTVARLQAELSWANLPRNPRGLADELAMYHASGRLPRMRAGAIGSEAELHNFRLEIPDDLDDRVRAALRAGRTDTYLIEGDHLRVVVDGPEGARVPEVVLRPAAVVPGDAGRASLAEALGEFDALLRRLSTVGEELVPIGTLAGGPFRVHPALAAVNIRATSRIERFAVHYSVGVPLARLGPFLTEVAAKTSVEHAAADARLALRLAARHRGRLPSTVDSEILEGYLALVHTQVRAVARQSGFKDNAAAVSRVSPQTILRALPQPVRQYIATNRQRIESEFDDIDLGEPLRNAGDRTAADYLDSALTPGAQEITQYDALGVRTQLDGLDTNDGTLDPALLVLELRSYGGSAVGSTSAEMRSRHGAIARLAADLYNEVRVAGGHAPSRLADEAVLPAEPPSGPAGPDYDAMRFGVAQRGVATVEPPAASPPEAIDFESKKVTLGTDQSARIERLAGQISSAARRAGSGRVVVHVEGGGKEHLIGNQGRDRAKAVAGRLETLLASLVRDGRVAFALHSRGEGVSANRAAPARTDSALRRQVLVWIEST